jgi:bile acid-coenzyme A ligase
VLQETVEREGVTGFMAPTPMLLRLARHPGLRRERFDSIEWVQHGASPLPDWLARFWIDFLGPERFFTSYGAAEAVGVVACRGEEWLAHPGTLGRGALGTDVVVLDDEGRRLAPHEIGQIYLRRPGGPSGTYAGRGVAPLAIDPDGFASVGDLGWLDEDGFVYLSDRRVDLIVSGGANVYPAEVEAAVGEHPDVDDVVVIGLPDEEWGKRVHAIVQRAPAAALTEEDVRTFVRARLARYKVPKTVEFVEQIPRSAATKVNRAALIEERVRPAAE